MDMNTGSHIFVDLETMSRDEPIRDKVISAAKTLAKTYPAHNVFVGYNSDSDVEFGIVLTYDRLQFDKVFKLTITDTEKPAELELAWQRR